MSRLVAHRKSWRPTIGLKNLLCSVGRALTFCAVDLPGKHAEHLVATGEGRLPDAVLTAHYLRGFILHEVLGVLILLVEHSQIFVGMVLLLNFLFW